MNIVQVSAVDCAAWALLLFDLSCRLLEQAAAASPEDLEAGLVQVLDVPLSHKYGGPVRADISIRMGGGLHEDRSAVLLC